MNKKNVFESFSEDKLKQYEIEAVANWGDSATQTIKLRDSYSNERKEEIMQEGGNIYKEIAVSMDRGADSPEIQALLVRWHEHVRNFYEPTSEVLGGLGNKSGQAWLTACLLNGKMNS